MNSFRDKLKQSGYDAEDAYFYKRDQELIEKMRAKNQPQLTLIQGGQQEKTPQLPAGRAHKKAA